MVARRIAEICGNHRTCSTCPLGVIKCKSVGTGGVRCAFDIVREQIPDIEFCTIDSEDGF